MRTCVASTSAIIPARNESGAIAGVVHAARRFADEVIVVDDGSSDATATQAQRAGARVVSLRPGRGKGHALRTGARAATGTVLVFLDGDGQDDPRDIPVLLAALHEGADLAIGTRFVGAIDEGAVTPIDRAGNRFLTELLNLLHGGRFTDSQAGFRALTRRLWDALPLHASGFEIETEVLVRALQAGAIVREVAVGRKPRVHGTRALHRVRDGLAIASCMLRLRLGVR